MECATYAIESEVEQHHWWFVVRRKLFAARIGEMNLPSAASILDIGTSTGTNLRLLKNMGFTNYLGLDSSDEAVRWCAEKGLGEVKKGDVCALPFADNSFDLILATDIIEHVEDDKKALLEIRRVLRPGGKVVLTVPAFESLWGIQDDVAMHQRRYRKTQLRRRLEETGWNIEILTYFNFILFAPIWLARQVIRLLKLNLKSENQVNNPFLNRLLTAIFEADITALKFFHPPFGVSLLAVLGK